MTTTLHALFNSHWTQALGWTLIHSLWQALTWTGMVVLALRFIPSRYSDARYTVATAGLFLIALSALATFVNALSAETLNVAAAGNTMYQNISFVQTGQQGTSFGAFIGLVITFLQANLSVITITWGIGAFLFSIRVLGGWWYVQKIRNSAQDLENGWDEHVRQLASTLGIHQVITLAESSLIQAPVVIGYIKPVILIPIGMFSGLSTEQIESIFIHELIHIRRGDYIVNLIQSVLEALFFFNPFVWMVSGIMRREREHCCDDAVIKIQGNALAYARALATLEHAKLSHAGLTVSLAQNKNQLLNRIKRIMEKSVKNYSGRERLAPLVLLVVGLICASWLTIQSTQSEKYGILEPGAAAEKIIAADTAGKEKTTRYSIRKVTTVGNDGQPQEQVIEEFEGDEDYRPFMLDMAMEIPPIAPIPPMDFDIAIPAIVDIPDFDMAIPPIPAVGPINFNFGFPRQFQMDTIPFPQNWNDSEDWNEFGKEFEKNFREKFGDFYEKHEVEFKEMMEELETKFNSDHDQAWNAEMETFARKAKEAQLEHRELWEVNQKLAKEMMDESRERFAEQANEMKKIEHEMKEIEKSMKAFEGELKDELVKDGYLDSKDKLNSIQVTDDEMTINGKKIKAADEKKYRALFKKLEHPTPGRRE